MNTTICPHCNYDLVLFLQKLYDQVFPEELGYPEGEDASLEIDCPSCGKPLYVDIDLIPHFSVIPYATTNDEQLCA